MNHRRFHIRALRFNAAMALVIWLIWYVVGGEAAHASIRANWPVSLTMVFGSLVGGGTSEGGGAVAFPVFTKVLHIAPAAARVFAFAIQTVGMGAASLSILFLRIPIERRVLAWAGTAGVAGMVLSTFYLAPRVPPPLVKISFSVMVASLAIALVILDHKEKGIRNQACPVFGAREKALITAAGLIGGVMSGLVGCGENIVTFMVMVLLFRISEKVATPTTVLLMTIVTIPAFALHAWGVGDFTPQVQGYWLAAVPIVAVGAPLGAFLCSLLTRRAIANILIGLIALDFISSVALIPMSRAVMLTAAGTLAVFSLLNWVMSRVELYRAPAGRQQA